MTIEITPEKLRNALRKFDNETYETRWGRYQLENILTDEQITKLLSAIPDKLNEIYPVAGSNSLYHKVDYSGRYGAFRFTLDQLIDAGIIGRNIITWASNNLSKVGDGPYHSKRRSSWADEAIKKYGEPGKKIIDFAAPRTETRNNILFYLLTNSIPYEVEKNTNIPEVESEESELAGALFVGNSTLSSEEFQIVVAYLYLQRAYQNLLTSRSISYNTQIPTIAGLLTVSLCQSFDWATSYANNQIKTNTDGVSARVWYELGWNTLSQSPKATLEEVTPVPDPITTAITNVKSTATSEIPEPDAASIPLSTTTDSGSPNAEPDVSDSLPKLPTLEQIAGVLPKQVEKLNQNQVSGDTYNIIYGVSGDKGQKGVFTARVIDTVTNTELANVTASSRNTLKTKLLKSLEKNSTANERILNKGITDPITANPLRIDSGKASTLIEWIDTVGYVSVLWEGKPIHSQTYTENDTFDPIAFSRSVERATNKVLSAKDAASLVTLATGISPNTLTRVKRTFDLNISARNAQRTIQSLSAIKNDVVSSFNKITSSLENWRNTPDDIPEPAEVVGQSGEVTAVSIKVFEDGSKVTTTQTEDADGNVSKTVTVEPAPPPLTTKEETPLEEDDAVPHPETDVAVAEGPNSVVSNRADNRQQNTQTVQQQTSNAGFQDPNRVYPTPATQNKPDTNVLALGVNSTHISSNPASPSGDNSELSRGASPAARSASRKRDVPMAGRNGETWSQPESPYAARYPYNKVFGGESGHVLEIDDTPGAERLNFAHRSGTFDEIGPDGTKVTKIVGDGYTIYENDGFILIEGQANVHVAGACNVYIAGDTNLTMHGKASIDVHNDLDLNVGGHIAVSAGKGIFVRNQGIFSLDNVGDIEMRGKGNMTQELVGTYNVTTTAGYNMTSKANSNVKVLGVSYTTSNGDMNFCTDAIFKAKSAGDMNLKSGAIVNQESAGDFNIKSGGAINEEGAGNINLKAPLVASSPIDTPTLDVSTANISTLNAGSTNLRATGTDTGTNGGSTHDLPISGPTTASVTEPGSAAAAAEAECAVPAPLANPVPLELPVSISRGASRNRSLAERGGASAETPAMANDGLPAAERNIDCEQSQSGSTNPSIDGSGADGSDPGPASLSQPPAGPYNVSPSGRTYTIPAGISSGRIPMDLKLSDNYTVFHLTRSDYWHGFRAVPGVAGVEDILRNMQAVANLVLEPLRRQYPGFTITSGARTYGYAPGNGASKSAHHIGAAVDLQWANRGNQATIARWIANNIRCDQVLFEDRRWIHVGLYRPTANRQQRGQWADTNANGNFLRTHRASYA